jgi:nucleoid-associated protein EbfC
MFDKFNINKIMESAQAMQDKMTEIEMTGEAGAGAVSITMNGKHKVIKIDISDEFLSDNNDKEILEDLIRAAFNDASAKLERKTQEMMDPSGMLGSIMGGEKEGGK